MNTELKSIKLRTRKNLQETAEQREKPVPVPSKRGMALLRADRLIRDLAVVGALFLTVLAVRGASAPQAQSVFSALKASANMQWDESLGQLSFVGGWLPESVQAVWNQKDSLMVFAPAAGQTVHTWSQTEPYVEWQTDVADVRCAADGQVMSVAHGLDEERIVRIRHENGVETVYGNLAECFVQEGDSVASGQIFARVLEGKPLAFELRRDGRSIDPRGRLMPLDE